MGKFTSKNWVFCPLMPYLDQFSFRPVLSKTPMPNVPLAHQNSPLVSVVVPSYNQAQYLERTLLSVINQNYTNWELLVCDGGSTDGSVDILKKYDKYIKKWVSEPDQGQTHALNKGLSWATGALICFQNSDDLFYPNCFETLVKYHEKHPNYDCYYGDLLLIDEYDNVTEELKTSTFSTKTLALEGMQAFNQALYFKPTVLQKWGAFDQTLRFALDYENVLRWSYSGATFTKVAGLYGGFRKQPDAKTTLLQDVRLKEHIELSNKYLQKLGLNKPNQLQIRWLKIKKMLYFLRKGHWAYIFYRLKL
jgi:glycosyltransferase involved in cell wall biosynthesis